MDELWAHLGISWVGIVSVVTSSTLLYLILAAVFRFWGQQLLGGISTFSLAVTTLLGAISARAALGDYPTLAGGMVALATLMVLERLLGRWEALRPGRRRPRRPPAILMIGEQVRHAELRRHRMTQAHLWSALRQRGVTSRRQIGLVVLESRGRLTVLRAGEPIDPALLHGVRGTDEIPTAWLENPT